MVPMIQHAFLQVNDGCTEAVFPYFPKDHGLRHGMVRNALSDVLRVLVRVFRSGGPRTGLFQTEVYKKVSSMRCYGEQMRVILVVDDC
jgi:hypothetical protein